MTPTLATTLGAVATYAAEHPDQVEHLIRAIADALGIARDGGVPLVSRAPRPFDPVAEMRDAERARVPSPPDAVPTEKEPIT